MSNRKATVALVLSVIALLISIAAAAIAVTATRQEAQVAPAQPQAEQQNNTEPIDPNSARIEYEMSTDGMSVTSLSYVIWQDGKATMVNDDGAPAPFRQFVDVPRDQDLAAFSVTGVGGSTSRQLTCTIKVDGVVVDTQTASGAYPIANCVAKKP